LCHGCPGPGNIVKYLSRNKCLSRGFLWRVR
jgi:hypothetical protein